MNTGGIKNAAQNRDYTVLPNEFIRNKQLTMSAKGLLTYLLSLPADWVVYKTELPNHFFNGYYSIMTAFSELEKFGYILSTELRDKTGKFKGFSYIVYNSSQKMKTDVNQETVLELEKPQIFEKKPIRDFPISDKPISDKPISGF